MTGLVSTSTDLSDARARALRDELASLREVMRRQGLLAHHRHLFGALQPGKALLWAAPDLKATVDIVRAHVEHHDSFHRAFWADHAGAM